MAETKTYEKLEDGRIKITTVKTYTETHEKIISKTEIEEKKLQLQNQIADLQNAFDKEIADLEKALAEVNKKPK